MLSMCDQVRDVIQKMMPSNEKIDAISRISEKGKQLEEKGLLKKKGNRLLPIEERHKTVYSQKNGLAY